MIAFAASLRVGRTSRMDTDVRPNFDPAFFANT